jgi:hypothetical protein
MTLPDEAELFRRLDEAHPGYPPGLPRPPGDEAADYDSVLHEVWETFKLDGRFAAAARLYTGAFTAHPHLLDGPSTRNRYRAACAAAMAGSGQGRDATDLDEATRVAFRRQALDWLRAELEARRRLLAKEPGKVLAVARDLQDWLWDSPFAGLRGPDALARLPEAERQEWQELWTDIADALARAVEMLPR